MDKPTPPPTPMCAKLAQVHLHDAPVEDDGPANDPAPVGGSTEVN